MKRSLYKVFLVVIISLGLLLASGCKKEPTFNDIIAPHMSEVVETSLTAEIYDGSNNETLVYKLERSTIIIVAGENYNARIITKTSELDQSFNLSVTPKTEEISNISLDELFKLNVSKSYFSSYNLTESSLLGVVKADCVKDFLNISSDSISSDVEVEFILDNSRLISYSMSFTLLSGRSVNVKANYYYE